MNDSKPSLDDWNKLEPFLKKHEQFEESQMRGLLFNRKHNGLEDHTRKIGKFIYINEPGFLNWIENYESR